MKETTATTWGFRVIDRFCLNTLIIVLFFVVIINARSEKQLKFLSITYIQFIFYSLNKI